MNDITHDVLSNVPTIRKVCPVGNLSQTIRSYGKTARLNGGNEKSI